MAFCHGCYRNQSPNLFLVVFIAGPSVEQQNMSEVQIDWNMPGVME